MSDDPYKAPEEPSAPQVVTNQELRSAVILLVGLGAIAAARWLVPEKHGVLAASAILLFMVLSDTIWSFIWPVIEQVDEDPVRKPSSIRWYAVGPVVLLLIVAWAIYLAARL